MILPTSIKKGCVIVLQETQSFINVPYFTVVISNDKEHPIKTKVGFLQALKDLGEGYYLVDNENIYGIYE